MKLFLIAVLSLEVSPSILAFTISPPHKISPSILNYRGLGHPDVQVESQDQGDPVEYDSVGHSPDDEMHYHDDDEIGKQIEDEMISEAFDLFGDVMEKAEEEAKKSVLAQRSYDAVVKESNGKRKKIKVLGTINPPLTKSASTMGPILTSIPPGSTVRRVYNYGINPVILEWFKLKLAKLDEFDGVEQKWWSRKVLEEATELEQQEPVVEEKSCSGTGTIKYAPDASMTGVDERYCRLCAAISGQIYNAKTEEDFDLKSKYFSEESKPKVLLFNDHTELAATTPPMVMVIADDKMIVGWRGSTTAMDWIVDTAFAPVSSSRFQHIGKGIRVQGAYAALIESDMALHEEIILDEIEKNGIKELIFTGHSLAGGIANVAHVMVAGERKKRHTEWNRSETLRNLTVRSIAFSPPMTTVLLDRDDDAARKFLQETVGRNTCNIVYKSDPVPRAYSDMSFLTAMVRNAFVESTDDMGFLMRRGANVASMFVSGHRLKKQAMHVFQDQVHKHADLIRVAARFQHQGKIVHYTDADSKPQVYVDKGSYFSKPEGHSVQLFRDIEYERPKESIQSTDVTVFSAAGDEHTFLVSGPGLAFGICEEEKKCPKCHQH